MPAGQAQKEFYVNEAHALMDALIHCAIEGEANDPPVNPSEGENWLISNTPTGDWSGQDGKLACFQAGNWLFATLRDGMQILDNSTGQLRLYRNGWSVPVTPAAPTGGATVDSEARTAIVALITALEAGGILPAT